jgi:RRXRR protein/HNH endonuclease
MSFVFVLNQDGSPLDPCPPARARRLLTAGRAVVDRLYPFTIRLRAAVADPSTSTYQLKVKPGSRYTGLGIVRGDGRVVWAGEIIHRSEQIRLRMTWRKLLRQWRRQRHTRYRKHRYHNRRRAANWLPPSLNHRVLTTLTQARRLCQRCPIAALAIEATPYDEALLRDPSRAVYTQGSLSGYEIRAYLLERDGRQCAYCRRGDVPLQIEHLIPRIRGGSSRLPNLTLACGPCNLKKGSRTAAEFGFPHLHQSIRTAAHQQRSQDKVRPALLRALQPLGLPIEIGTSGQTRYHRVRLGLGLHRIPWLDALCVGASTPEHLDLRGISPLYMRAVGHGSRQMVRNRNTRYRGHRARQRRRDGWQSGDIVVAQVPRGRFAGAHRGRLVMRFGKAKRFGLRVGAQLIDVYAKNLRRLHRADGYDYAFRLGEGGTAAAGDARAEPEA